MKFNTLFEQLLNGLAKGKTLEDIAKKHKIENHIDSLQKEFEKGISVEKEHTKDENTSKIIAMDHLWEDPEYYTKLQKIENK
jgi:hypothetical protein